MLVHVRIYIVSPTVKYDRRYISLLEKYLDMLSCTEFFSAKSLHRILCRLTQNSVQTYTEFCADLHRILCTQNSVQCGSEVMHMMLYELHSTIIIIINTINGVDGHGHDRCDGHRCLPTTTTIPTPTITYN